MLKKASARFSLGGSYQSAQLDFELTLSFSIFKIAIAHIGMGKELFCSKTPHLFLNGKFIKRCYEALSYVMIFGANFKIVKTVKVPGIFRKDLPSRIL